MSRKGDRAELDALLESAWEGQQKRKKWAGMHPSTGPDRVSKSSSRNLSDSLAIVGILLGILFWIFVPTLVVKGIAVLVCAGLVIYLSYKSHWTRTLSLSRRHSAAVICALCILGLGGRQLYVQYRFHPPLSLQAFTAQDFNPGENVGGIVWGKGFNDIRLTIRDISTYPLQNIDLSISLPGTAVLNGVGQLEDIQGVSCSFHNEGKDIEPDFELHGDDGQWYDFRDLTKNINLPSLAWKVFCPILPTEVPLRLVIAAIPFKGKVGTKRIRILGSYGIASGDGGRQVKLDKTWNFD